MSETSLRVIPLGGLGEIGKNMMALEYDDDIVVIDSGVLFPSEEMPGIDFAIPDISYLKENSSRVRAILITHGHEDHIGALPYVLSELNVPVYASRLTHGLISVKLREFGLLKDARLNVVEPHSPFKIGAFKAEFFRVCHSIPDAMGIALQTPLGTVVHTGDFKIDHTPADGKSTDFAALSQLTGNGVLLLLSDSTYAESEGYTESEQVVGQALEREIIGADGRVLVATFASLISRVQQVIDAAVKCDRKVAVIGRSMINNVKMALNMGYLKAPAGTIIPLSEALDLPLNQIVILATGAQGEPTSALVRISNGDHQDVEIVPGDTVIISASPIPGNETLVSRTIDNLYRQEARVLHSKIALVHVHGHASREELKMMLAMVKPKFFIPVHGEYRHLVAHAEIARSMGVAEENAMVLEDGDVLELTADHGTIVDRIPAGHVYVNGRRMWGDDGKVLAERGRLAREGVVTVVVSVDASSGEVVNTPSLLSSGFIELDESADLLERTSEEAQIALEQLNGRRLELDELRSLVSNSVSKFLYDETRRRPKVLTHIQEV
ncbi:MAG: ribonuclease J [SAR202 cluster bacterium]|jgi:ribonuclease J|nr:ribonuclease J [SAR202 cluster bacterium]